MNIRHILLSIAFFCVIAIGFSQTSSNLSSFRYNDKYGFKDNEGNIVIKAQYDNVYSFKNGLAKVKNNNKYGLINEKGKIITKCKYDTIYDFYEGFAIVKLNNKFGFIDRNGNIKIDITYDKAHKYNNGKAIVSKNGIFYSIDKKDTKTEIGKYYDVNGIYNAFIITEQQEDSTLKYRFLNKDLKTISKKAYSNIGEFDSFIKPNVVVYNQNYGLFNLDQFKETVPCIYGYIDFYELSEINGRYVNKLGAKIKKCAEGYNTFDYKYGLVSKNNKYGIIDSTGKEIIPCIYDEFDPYTQIYRDINNNFLGFLSKNKKFGLININTGKELTEFKYEDYAFSGFDELMLVTTDNKYTFIDLNGKELIPLIDVADISKNYSEISIEFNDEYYIQTNTWYLLSSLAYYYYNKGELNKAIDIIGEDYEDKLNYLFNLHNNNCLGLIYQKKYQDEIKAYYKSLYYLFLGKLAINNQNYEKASEYLNISQNENTSLEKNILLELIRLNIATNNIKQAEYYSQKAINNYKKDKLNFNIYYTLSIYYEKYQYYSKALYYMEIANNYINEINIYNYNAFYSRYAVLNKLNGNIPKAIEFFNESINNNYLENNADTLRLAADYVWLGKLYSDQNNIDKAIEYHKKSLSLRLQTNDLGAVAESYLHIGNNYKKQSKVNKNILVKDSLKDLAVSYYKKAYQTSLSCNDTSRMANSLYLIGKTINKKSYFYKSLELYETKNDTRGVAHCKILLCESFIKGYKDDSLNIYATDISKLAKKLNTPEILKSSYKINFKNSIIKLELDKADIFQKDIIDIDNRAIISNFSTMGEKEQERYLQTISDDFMIYNSYALSRSKTNQKISAEVYNNTIKNKGLLLKSSTAMRNAVLNSNDTILIKDYNNWIEYKKLISQFYAQGKDTKILEEEANELEKKLVKSSQDFSSFSKLQNISWKDIQNQLNNNEIAIEFINFKYIDFSNPKYFDFKDSTMYCALIITPKSKYPEMIPLFKEKQLEKIIGKFGGNNYSYINGIYGKNNEVNTELYNLIWAPIDSFLTSKDLNQSEILDKTKVFISPSGLLHKISFSAIAKKQNIYLCDSYDIEIKSTTGKIVEQNQATAQSRTLTNATLFGGINYNTNSTKQEIWKYLEGTKTETQEIDKILKAGKVNVKYFTNNSATEEEFKLMASNSNILHIATHGFFYPDPKEIQKDEEKNVEVGEVIFRGGNRGFGVNSFVENKNPLMRSGLVFARANDVWSKENKNDSIEDGVLTAQEVATIDMRKTDLVVMSACETGLGDIKGSEGVYGLQRAFKMAGVQYEIMSLWQVPDKETEEFMTTFYKKLIKQKDIKKAFAQTQKEMRAKYDPYFWAAFVLIE